MRPLVTLSLACLLAASAMLPAQEEKKPGGISGYRQSEKERLEQELVGAWILLEYRNPREVLERGHYSGFASFQSGYFNLMLRIDALSPSLLGPQPQTIVQAGVHQYRLTGDARLQTATVMGFSNDTPDFELQADPGGFPREFAVFLKDDALTLRRWDDLELVFRRADATGSFPKRSADVLDRYRGRVFTPPDDWGKERR